MSAIYFVLPTPYQARTLREFTDVLEKVQLESIYSHLYESKLRLAKPANDISHWIESQFGLQELARQAGQLEPYSLNGEGLRRELIRLLREAITE